MCRSNFFFTLRKSVLFAFLICIGVVNIYMALHQVIDFSKHIYTKPSKWYDNATLNGHGNFCGFDRRFALLTNVVLDPANGHGKLGGEAIEEVKNQSESEEYFMLESGFFSIQCQVPIVYKFNKNSYLNSWLETLTCRTDHSSRLHDTTMSSWTIISNRTDYANLYVTMVDFYNAFLMIKHFNIDVNDLTVLWIDGHPKGALDDTWTSLFGRVVRVGALKQPTLFNNLIWCPKDPLPGKNPNSLEEFRSFFLQRHGLSPKHKLNCSQLNITFVWRHDYLAHPRRMSGFVDRKIKNEDELIEAAKSAFSSHHVTGVQLDTLDMTGQLGLVSTTDIFVGMHGAGLTHTMFLPKKSVLLELFPYRHNMLSHMRGIAQARRLRYAYWQNKNTTNDLGQGYTHVHVEEIISTIGNLSSTVCL